MTESIEIKLERRLKCEAFNILMTISRFEGQNEILAILKLFEEHGTVTSSIVNDELLSQPGSSHYGQNILKAVETYGLIKTNSRGRFELTPMGDEALNLKKIPFPNKGLFKVILSEDQLLQSNLVDISESKDNIISGKAISELPESILHSIEKWERKTLRVPAKNLEPMIIKEYNNSGVPAQYSEDYRLSLRIRFNESPMMYFLGNSRISISPPGDMDSFKILEELLTSFGKLTLQDTSPVLLVKTKGLTLSELQNFVKTFRIQKPNLKKYGSFDSTYVNNLKIVPESLSEARKWARSVFISDLNHYVSSKSYRELSNFISRKFEPMYDASDVAKGLPSLEEAIKLAKNGSPEFESAFWYLVAPDDLSPRRL